MLGAEVFVALSIGFFVGAVNDAFEARRKEYLVCVLVINRFCTRALDERVFHARMHRGDVYRQALQNMLDDAFALFEQREQDTLAVVLCAAIALDNSLSVLRAFGESIKL